VLAALVVLSLVNRSIQRQVPVGPAHADTQSGAARAPAAKTSSDATSAVAKSNAQPMNDAGIDSEPKGKPPQAKEPSGPAKEKSQLLTRKPIAQEGAERNARPQELQGAARIIAVLQEAVQQKDHARIKQCLDDLVALGDQAIAPLTQVIADEQGEVGEWAAEALARLGTPLATQSLLDALTQIKEGQYKEQLGKRVAAISNHDSWPVLLDNVLNTADSTVLRAAGDSLSRMADAPVVDELIARYDGAATEQDTARIAQVISNIRSSGATKSLIDLAGDVASAPQDALARAAIEGLSNIGDPQAISYLMRKLEATPPGESGYLMNTISQIKGPQAQDALLYAAAGNKEVSADNGRTAAIYALRNFPDSRTCALLEQIVAAEQNASVVTAATRTLDDIRRTSPHVVANAQSLVKKDIYPSSEPIKK
jgi:HEAT repeat protein